MSPHPRAPRSTAASVPLPLLGLLAIGAALLCVAVFVILESVGGSGAASGELLAAEEEGRRAPAALDGPGAPRDVDPDAPEAAVAPVGDPGRVAVEAEAAPTAPDAPAAALPVAGVLLDEHGRGVAGARVRYELGDALLEDWDVELASPVDFTIYSRSGIHELSTTTGPTGTFVFEGTDDSREATLTFGYGLYLGGRTLSQLVDRTGHEQVLRLPPTPRVPAVLVDTRDTLGRPVRPQLVELQLLGGVSEGYFRHPAEASRRVHAGGLELEPLAPGDWQLWVAGTDTDVRELRFTVPADGPDLHLDLALGRYPGAGWQLGLSPARDAETWPDMANGFDEWLPDTRRGYGDASSNRHFGHTLTDHGEGELRGALLQLRLRATADVPTNDSIHLEYQGPEATPRFGWSRRVADLPGVGAWNRGKRRTIVLDLARLPTADGTTDLLAQLEDGRLDVVVADDTVVEDLQLHVLR